MSQGFKSFFRILPGTKNTMGDLKWLRQNGMEMRILQLARAGCPVLGICGGYQMMGENLSDPEGVEYGGEMKGLGLLPVTTVFETEKIRTRVAGRISLPFGSARLEGYEIHMGRTERENADPFCVLESGKPDGAVSGSCFGTYLHGLFDTGELTACFADWLLARKGLSAEKILPESHREFQERQFNLLADEVRGSLNLPAIYNVMEAYAHG